MALLSANLLQRGLQERYRTLLLEKAGYDVWKDKAWRGTATFTIKLFKSRSEVGVTQAMVVQCC